MPCAKLGEFPAIIFLNLFSASPFSDSNDMSVRNFAVDSHGLEFLFFLFPVHFLSVAQTGPSLSSIDPSLRFLLPSFVISNLLSLPSEDFFSSQL